MWAYLVQGAALGFAAAAMPGPFQAYMISQALQRGWRRAAWIALAPLVSDGPIILAVVLLLARLPGWSLNALQIVGGGFILYLALGAWRALRAAWVGPALPAPQDAAGLTLLKAATVNLLSPVVYVFWATVSGPLFMRGWAQRPALGIAFIVAFYGVMVVVSQAIILLVTALRGVHAQATRVMLALSFLLLVGMGLAQIWAGLAALRV
ncbi:MAG: LysE family transporter [Chloroflexota bacterium]